MRWKTSIYNLYIFYMKEKQRQQFYILLFSFQCINIYTNNYIHIYFSTRNRTTKYYNVKKIFQLIYKLKFNEFSHFYYVGKIIYMNKKK